MRSLLYFPAVLTFRSGGPGGRSEGIRRRPARASGRTGWPEEASEHSKQQGHETASPWRPPPTSLLFERSHIRPWRRTAPWSTQSGGDYAHVFMPEDGVGLASRVSQLRS